MTKQEMITYATSICKKITDRILAVPKATALFISVANGGGMQFGNGLPMVMGWMVTTPQEETTVQNATEPQPYYDMRTNTYWTKATGSWVSSPYTGGRIIRNNTLFIGVNNNKVYFFAEFGKFYEVDVTTPTPV